MMPAPQDRTGPAPLPRYLLLYAALYAGWGVLSPFLPAVLAARGAAAEQIGLLLAGGIVVRLVATPAAGHLADRLGAPRQVLAGLLLASAGLGLGYGLVPIGFAWLLLVGLAQHAASGPVGPLPDALAVRAAAHPRQHGGFDYGIVRGVGSAAFIAGTLLAGPAVTAAGSVGIVLWLNAGLFACAAGATLLLPPPALGTEGRAAPLARPPGGLRALLAIPAFRRLLLVAGLISGSHAFYTGFATLRWEAAGIAPEIIGLFWAVAVAAEVAVFFLFGRRLLARLGPGGVCVLAAAAGVLRWSVMAATAWVPAMLLVQPLHGLTFAAQHLAAMMVLAQVAPGRLVATAQSVYASIGTGLVSAALTLASGPLYARLGAGGFWVMALLCAAAVPAAFALRAAAAWPEAGGQSGPDWPPPR